MRFPNKDFFKQNRKVLIVGTAACLLGLIALASMTHQGSDGYANGYIICENESSEEIENLFYRSGDRYLIELAQLDKCLDLDAIKSDGGYVIRTPKVQCTMKSEEESYKINANTIQDDDNYITPAENSHGFYADADTLFDVFGYQTSYKTNDSGKLVELTLTKADGSAYDTIHISTEVPETEDARSQVEEGILNQDPESGKPGGTSLPTVPQPTSPSEEETEPSAPVSEGDFLENGETYPDEIQEVIDNRPEPQETEAPKKQIIERPTENPNKKRNEEFQQQWDQVSENLKKTYSTGATPTGKEPVKERTKDFIAYNPMSGAIFYDTISVLHDPADGAFMEATIANEWSDMALNTDHEQTKAFYESIPGMVEATLKDMLGANTGEELFQFIKEHADRTANGGYIAYHDEKNEIQTEWTDGPVGDGINAGEIDFEKWQDRTTDDGLRFYVARSGGGIFIKVYKN